MKLKLISLENLEKIEIEDTEFLKGVGILVGHSHYVEVYDKNLKIIKILYHKESILDLEYEPNGNYVISKKSWNFLFENLKRKKMILMSYENVKIEERYLEQLVGGLDV